MPLGKLEHVDLRKQWPDESKDFTPWLSSQEGLSLLGEAIGMELELEATEVSVGNYRADIVAKDTLSNQYVVIENQLETTNHDHIGKLLRVVIIQPCRGPTFKLGSLPCLSDRPLAQSIACVRVRKYLVSVRTSSSSV